MKNNIDRKLEIKSSLMLITTSLIWGFAFAAQKVGMERLSIHSFNALRFILASVVLALFIFIRGKRNNKDFKFFEADKLSNKYLVIGGIVCGLVLTIGNLLQTYGIKQTSVGKAGFITILYIVIVPVGGLFFKKKVPKIIWLSAAIALFGSYLLFIKQDFDINIGDLFVFASSFLFAAHIMVIDYYTKRADSVKLAFLQFVFCALVNSLLMLYSGLPSINSIISAALPILFAGVLSSGLGYTFQFIAQKNISAPAASIIMSMESVFSVIAGWLILKEQLTLKELMGCALIFFAIILVQIPYMNKKQAKQQA